MAFLAPLIPSPRTRRKPRRNPTLSIPRPENDSDPSLRLLHKRLSELRERQVQRDRHIAHAWRNARYKPSVIASIERDYVRKLAFEGPHLAFGTASGATAFAHIPSGRQLISTLHAGQTTAIDYRDGFLASVGSAAHTPAIWDMRACENPKFWRGAGINMPDPVVLQAHEDIVTALRVEPSHDRVYSASVDGTVRISNLSGTCIEVIRVGEPVLSMKLTADRYLLLGCASGRVQAYQAEKSLYLLSLVCHRANTTAIDFCDQSQTLVTGASSGKISLWNLKDSSSLGELPGHDSAVMSLQIDGSKVVSAGRDGCIAVAGVDSLQRFYSLHGFTKYLACARFDDIRLVADGTNDVIVCHNFDSHLDNDCL